MTTFTDTLPTIQKIKKTLYAGSNVILTQRFMKLHGLTLSSFKVRMSPSGKIYVYASTKTGDVVIREYVVGINGVGWFVCPENTPARIVDCELWVTRH